MMRLGCHVVWGGKPLSGLRVIRVKNETDFFLFNSVFNNNNNSVLFGPSGSGVRTLTATSFVGWDAATGLETTWTGLIFPGGISVNG